MSCILRLLGASPLTVSQIFSTRLETLNRLPAYCSISGMNGIASTDASPSSVARISAGARTSTTSPGLNLRSLMSI